MLPGGRAALVPVLDLAVPAGGGDPAVLQRVPLGVDAHLVVGLDVAVGLAALPVPEPDLALAVPGGDVFAVRREARLAGVAGGRVTLQQQQSPVSGNSSFMARFSELRLHHSGRLVGHQVLMHEAISCRQLRKSRVEIMNSQIVSARMLLPASVLPPLYAFAVRLSLNKEHDLDPETVKLESWSPAHAVLSRFFAPTERPQEQPPLG